MYVMIEKGAQLEIKKNMGRPLISERKINVCNDRKGGTIRNKKTWERKINGYNDKYRGTIGDTKNMGRPGSL